MVRRNDVHKAVNESRELLALNRFVSDTYISCIVGAVFELSEIDLEEDAS